MINFLAMGETLTAAESGTKRRQATATLEGDDLDNFAIGVFRQ